MVDTWNRVGMVPIRTVVYGVGQAYEGHGYFGKLIIVRGTCVTLRDILLN